MSQRRAARADRDPLQVRARSFTRKRDILLGSYFPTDSKDRFLARLKRSDGDERLIDMCPGGLSRRD